MNFATDYANMREKIDLAYMEMIDSIQELHDISDDGCRELIEEYADVITEINAVYKSIEDCAVDTAFSLGLATKENEDKMTMLVGKLMFTMSEMKELEL